MARGCVRLILSLLLASFFLAGCTATTPEMELLDSSAIPQPLFYGSKVQNVTTDSSTATFSISGQCDTKISAIVGIAVGTTGTLSTLNDIAVAPATVECSNNGTFSFDLKNLTDLGYTVSEGQTYEVQLRGVTTAGVSNPSSIRIYYTTVRGANRIILTGGAIHGGGDSANKATSGLFSANIFVSPIQGGIVSGGPFIMKIGNF